jgi:cell shape-determining protein MreC
MGDKFIELLGTIFTIAAGVAIVSVIVSRNSNTSSVIQSWFSGNSNLLAVAESPVTGASVSVNTSYPSNNVFGDLSSNLNFGQGSPAF